MSAFFSGTETACFSLDQLQKKRLAETVGGKKALRILVDPGILMASILLGNTFVNVAASTIAAMARIAHSIAMNPKICG